jgi:tetratricopeptide (TPR) repeat protein
MPASVERGAVRPPLAASEPADRARLVLAPVVLVGAGTLAAAAIFAGGGSTGGPTAWIGAGAALLVASLGVAASFGAIPWPRLDRPALVAVGLFAGLVVWTGVTVAWSTLPDRSWDQFDRGLAYVALLLTGIFAGALVRRAPQLFAAGLAVLVGAALVYALAGKVFPSLFPDGARVARMREPVGYWNALALLLALGLPLALWAASLRRHHAALRAGAVAFLFALEVGVLLTYSRGGVVAAVVAVAAWLALSSPRLESLVALFVATPLALGVTAWAFHQPGVTSDGQPGSVRAEDGHLFGIVLLAGVLVVFAVAYLLCRTDERRPLADERRRRVARTAGAVLATGVVGAAIVLAVRLGNPLEQLDSSSGQVTQDLSRLGELSSNLRLEWWGEAWQGFLDEPLRGTGAGSFEATHLLERDSDVAVTEPHNLALQLLSETGIVGFLLAAGAVAAGALALHRALRRLDGTQRAAAAALLAGVVAYAVHSFLDIGWDFVAVTTPVLLATGALLAAGHPAGDPGRARRPFAAGLCVLVLLAAVWSLAAPRLADRSVDRAYDRVVEGRPAAALSAAERARDLDPLAIEPLHAEAFVRGSTGDVAGARQAYVRAIDLQPRNSEAWLALGLFELRVTGDRERALRPLDTAYALDPYGPAGALLDELRGS